MNGEGLGRIEGDRVEMRLGNKGSAAAWKPDRPGHGRDAAPATPGHEAAYAGDRLAQCETRRGRIEDSWKGNALKSCINRDGQNSACKTAVGHQAAFPDG